LIQFDTKFEYWCDFLNNSKFKKEIPKRAPSSIKKVYELSLEIVGMVKNGLIFVFYRIYFNEF